VGDAASAHRGSTYESGPTIGGGYDESM